MAIKIALAGNPNCGKTTMFNDLTGSSQYVGNWPGVTVEKKEGVLKGHKDVSIIDLPGIYSLSPYTLEEVVTRDYIINERPDVILNLVDASNIERNLYLTTQLLEMGIPVVIAMNMIDIVKKRGDIINISELSKILGCKIIETSALKGQGTIEAAKAALEVVEQDIEPVKEIFQKNVEKALRDITLIIQDVVDKQQQRWFSIKLFERDEKVIERFSFNTDVIEKLENIISECEKEMDDDSESIITNERYEYINNFVSKFVKKKSTNNMTTSDKIDRIVTNRFFALPFFAIVMWLVYYISVSTVGTIATDWTNDIFVGEIIQGNVATFLENVGTVEWLQSLIVDGIIGGVGAVIGFLPQMLVLFFFLSILEDCGYMARIAFIMDRIFRKFGLSGKSFIPMLIGTGCGVPGVMASRTIENEKDRKMTIMTTTFIPCGAKLPIIALIAGALFPESSWVGPSAYFIGIGAIIFSGILLKKTTLFSGDPAPFVMELPPYHIPAAKGVLIHMWDRGKSFVKKAGTIIFVACGIIWFLQSFNWSLQMVDASESILASIGNVIAPLFAPLGWGDWKAAVAAVTGLVAKENVVGTFGVLYGMNEVAEDGIEIWTNLQGAFTQVSAYSFLAFNLLCAPCFAAIGAIKREMGNWKWTLIAVGYQTGLAYIVSLLINTIGNTLLYGASPIPAIICIIAVIIVIALICINDNKKQNIAHKNFAQTVK
ncbi:MAG: ferrous iron transport protein B [Firmicutes bacterium]|nr:ferrous iron transport protein B [Bacillota bacterium]